MKPVQKIRMRMDRMIIPMSRYLWPFVRFSVSFRWNMAGRKNEMGVQATVPAREMNLSTPPATPRQVATPMKETAVLLRFLR